MLEKRVRQSSEPLLSYVLSMQEIAVQERVTRSRKLIIDLVFCIPQQVLPNSNRYLFNTKSVAFMLKENQSDIQFKNYSSLLDTESPFSFNRQNLLPFEVLDLRYSNYNGLSKVYH